MNKRILDIRKRLDNDGSTIYDDNNDDPVSGMGTAGQRQDFGQSQSEQLHGISRMAESTRNRKSTDRERYDADPRVLSGDFSELELKDEGMGILR